MNTIDTQIKQAYEVLEMTPSQISEDQSLDEAAVKAKLMQVSAKYRKACGMEAEDVDELNFNDEQLKEVNKIIYELALSAEDEHLRAKMATYIRDDKKGRKEVVKQVANHTFNILTFNEMIQQARVQAGAIRKQIEQPKEPIEV